MSASSKSTVTSYAMLAFPLRPFSTLLLKLPVELILEILGYALSLPGVISNPQFCGGECEWPSCQCRDGVWKRIPAEQLTKDILVPFSAAPHPIPRLAQLVFYKANTFHFCGPQNDGTWSGPGFWLPPVGVRHWIRHLEVEIQIANPRSGSFLHQSTAGLAKAMAPMLDWEFLRRLQRGVHGFTALRTLKLKFEAMFITKGTVLQLLDNDLGMLEPFCFQTQIIVVEACSAYPVFLDDDVMSGDVVRDGRLERVLAKYVSATGKQQSLEDKDAAGAATLLWQEHR